MLLTNIIESIKIINKICEEHNLNLFYEGNLKNKEDVQKFIIKCIKERMIING